MIHINGNLHPFERQCTLLELFRDMDMNVSKGVAVAVNNKVVPRESWETCLININDKIILIKATQGG